MNAKPTPITLTALAALAPLVLPLAACELAGPLLIAEATKGDDPTAASSAALTVEVEQASGIVAGRPVSPEMFRPAGERFESQLTFHLATQEGDVEVMVISTAEGSAINPYTGESGDPGAGDARPVPPPAEGTDVGLVGDPFADVMVCESGSCRSASDFGVEIVQTEDGRRAVIDGVWGETENIQLTLHYTEG